MAHPNAQPAPPTDETFISPPPLDFSETALTLENLLGQHSLPRVIKCETLAPNRVNALKANLNLNQPLLAFMAKSVRKVSAHSLSFNSDLGEFCTVGNGLLIPEDYPGWFAVMGPPHEVTAFHQRIRHYTTISCLATSGCSKFLIGGKTPVHGFLIKNDQTKPCQVLPGTVLRAVSLYRQVNTPTPPTTPKPAKKGTKQPPTPPTTPKPAKKGTKHPPETRESKFLECQDQHNRSIFIPVHQKGVFYVLARGDKSASPTILQMKDILERLRFPLIVKLLYGRVPTTPCSFTQVLLLTDSGMSRTLVASTLLYYSNINLEIPVGSDLKFYTAKETDELLASKAYNIALTFCMDKTPTYIKDMKVVFGSAQLERDEAASRNGRQHEAPIYINTSSPGPREKPVCSDLDISVPRPTDTSVPRPTDTSVPRPNDTSVPRPTNNPFPRETKKPAPRPRKDSLPSPGEVLDHRPGQSSGNKENDNSVQNHQLFDPQPSPPAPSHGLSDPHPSPPAPSHGLSHPHQSPPAPSNGLSDPHQSPPVMRRAPSHGLSHPHQSPPATSNGLSDPHQSPPVMRRAPSHGLSDPYQSHPAPSNGLSDPQPSPPVIRRAPSHGLSDPHPSPAAPSHGLSDPHQSPPVMRAARSKNPYSCGDLPKRPVSELSGTSYFQRMSQQVTVNEDSFLLADQPSMKDHSNKLPSAAQTGPAPGQLELVTTYEPPEPGQNNGVINISQGQVHPPFYKKNPDSQDRPEPPTKAVYDNAIPSPCTSPNDPWFPSSNWHTTPVSGQAESNIYLKSWDEDRQSGTILIPSRAGRPVSPAIPTVTDDTHFNYVTMSPKPFPSTSATIPQPPAPQPYARPKTSHQSPITRRNDYLEPVEQQNVYDNRSITSYSDCSQSGYSDHNTNSGIYEGVEQENEYCDLNQFSDANIPDDNRPNHLPQLPPRHNHPKQLTLAQVVLKSISQDSDTGSTFQGNKQWLLEELKKAGFEITPTVRVAFAALQAVDLTSLLSGDEDYSDAIMASLPTVGELDLRALAVCLRAMKLRT